MSGNQKHRLYLFRRCHRRYCVEAGRNRRILIRIIRALAVGSIASAALATGPGQGDPALDYLLQCQGCHREDGSGAEAIGVPRLAGFVGRFTRVEGGRAYLVQVPGVAQAPLDDEAIAALLNWMLRRFSASELSDSFAPYTAEEVTLHRSRAPIEVVATRAALLARLEEYDELESARRVSPQE